MPIQTRPNWTQLTNRPTTVAASGLTDAATVTQATQAANPGTIAYFAANTPPNGWLACNGAAVARSTFAALFSAIGTTYGAGNGSTTFNLPDLRGEFIRGHDGGRGVDSGRVFGAAQAGEIQSHTHVVQNVSTSSAELNINPIHVNSFGNGSRTSNATGGTETRPRNVALLACIKF